MSCTFKYLHSLKDVLINFAGFRIMCQKLWQFSTRRNCYPAIYGRIERFAKTHNGWQHQAKNPWNASNLGNGFSKFSSLSNCYSESFNNRFLRERGMVSNPKMEYQVLLCIFQKNSAMATLCLKEMGKFLSKGRKKVCPVGCLCLEKLNSQLGNFFPYLPKRIFPFPSNRR